MNIEIANKLLELRKEKGLSQEALANKLGISRQAVSKWERAEASPDTDNLIELAKLYDISLDELLLHEPSSKKQESTEKDEHVQRSVHIGKDGIHVQDDQDEVHISFQGIHVKEREGHQVDIDSDGVFVDGEKKDWKENKSHSFPLASLVFLVYIIYGLLSGHWHPAWILLFTIPLIESCIKAIHNKKFASIDYSIFAFMIFLYLGFTKGLWHPGWIIFMTIPCFYLIANYIDHHE